MPEGITEIQKPTTSEQPKTREKLSDEQMGNLLAAVGNHEAKAITLILMRNGNIYDRTGLHREVINAQGKNKGWKMDRSGPFQYCSHSLAPIGLVAKETLNSDLSTYGYQITEDGKELGIPLAGLLLDFSERHNISLSELLGSTLSSSSKEKIMQTEKEETDFKKRSPSTTLKIFYELLTSSSLPIREADLGKRIGEKNSFNLTSHLIRLSKLGLIEYKAIEVNKPFSSYKLSPNIPEGKLPIDSKRPTLTLLILNILKEHPNKFFTIREVYNFLPQEQKGSSKKKNLLGRISNVLSFLRKHDYANIEKFHLGKQSEINVKEEARIVLTEFLEIMYGFQNQDREILEKGRKLARAIIIDPKRVSNLLRRAKEVSSYANRSSIEETQKHILSIIFSNPGITNREIQKLLERKLGKKLKIGSVNILSSSFIKQGAIKVVRKGNLGRFYSNNKDSSAS